MSGRLKADPSFAERLRKAIGTESENSFATRCGVSRPLLRQYLTGSEPGMAKVVAIAKAADVTVQWLATGEGPMRPSEGAPSAVQAAAAVDEELLACVAEGIALIYKEENARIYTGPLVRAAARMYDDLVAACDTPDERQAGLKAMLQQLRRELRSAGAAGANSKQVS